MKSLITTIVFLTSLNMLSQSIDNEQIVILDDQSENQFFRFRGHSYWQLSDSDFEQTKKIIIDCISDHKDEYYAKSIFKNLKDYYFQFIPYVDSDNNPKVYVSAFCVPGENWKSQLVDVDDGGSCFWQVQVDANNYSYDEFRVNGY